nr:Rrf2 family transcriptional regulator [uncultured Blautia sp.]
MKLSTRAKYGLKALIDLGLNSEKETVSIQSIATRQNISVSYLEQLMALLKKAGLVKSVRGAGGGYLLGRPAEEISVGDILRVLEGGLDAASCPGIEGDGGCQGSDLCVAKFVWKRINDSITDAVDTLMLSELIRESKEIQKK